MKWRLFLARLPLPMLALAASYGVYSFAQLFVPLGIAIIQAAAFELTYIGLAVTRDLSGDDRRRATTISIGAVVASIIYNTLAGWFHRQPALLDQASPIAWLMFAILHGAPLAWVAYLVADLLLHTNTKQPLDALPERLGVTNTPDQAVQDMPALPLTQERVYFAPLELAAPALEEVLVIQAHRYACPHCSQALLSKQALGAAVKNGYCLGCKRER